MENTSFNPKVLGYQVLIVISVALLALIIYVLIDFSAIGKKSHSDCECFQISTAAFNGNNFDEDALRECSKEAIESVDPLIITDKLTRKQLIQESEVIERYYSLKCRNIPN